MLARPGCAEILPARSRAVGEEEEEGSGAALPGTGSEVVACGRVGRRGARRENWRGVRWDRCGLSVRVRVGRVDTRVARRRHWKTLIVVRLSAYRL